jgi:hypothetical protein
MRPNKMPGKLTCEKLHYSTETVGNLTRTHIEGRLKMDNGSEKKIEGTGQSIFPKFPASSVMAWKFSDHGVWHGEHTVSLEVPFGRQLFGILTKEWNGHVDIKVGGTAVRK